MGDIYIAKWDTTKYIVGSSWTFCIPAIYAYYRHFYVNTALLIITSIISANYWRKATYSWRRDLDLVYSKFVFTVFVSQGIYHVRYTPYIIVSYPLMGTLIYFFYLSGKYYAINHSDWYRYHVAFHILMTCELFMIINSIPPSYLT
jgi:hypothetical protein